MVSLITSAGGTDINEKNKQEAEVMILDENKDKKLI